MSRAKKSIFKNLLTRDIIYILNKTVCLREIKEGNYKLVPIEAQGWYYGSSWRLW